MTNVHIFRSNDRVKIKIITDLFVVSILHPVSITQKSKYKRCNEWLRNQN